MRDPAMDAQTLNVRILAAVLRALGLRERVTDRMVDTIATAAKLLTESEYDALVLRPELHTAIREHAPLTVTNTGCVKFGNSPWLKLRESAILPPNSAAGGFAILTITL